MVILDQPKGYFSAMLLEVQQLLRSQESEKGCGLSVNGEPYYGNSDVYPCTSVL
jgi:hypothetical protein